MIRLILVLVTITFPFAALAGTVVTIAEDDPLDASAFYEPCNPCDPEVDTGTITLTDGYVFGLSERLMATAIWCVGEDCKEVFFYCEDSSDCTVTLSDGERERGYVTMRAEVE